MSFFLVSFFLITNYMQVIDLWLFLLLHHFTDVTSISCYVAQKSKIPKQSHPLVATLHENRKNIVQAGLFPAAFPPFSSISRRPPEAALGRELWLSKRDKNKEIFRLKKGKAIIIKCIKVMIQGKLAKDMILGE